MGALQCIAAKMTKFGLKRYFDGLNSILHVFSNAFLLDKRVIRCGEGVTYLTSLRHPTDIGLQLGKLCYPFSR